MARGGIYTLNKFTRRHSSSLSRRAEFILGMPRKGIYKYQARGRRRVVGISPITFLLASFCANPHSRYPENVFIFRLYERNATRQDVAISLFSSDFLTLNCSRNSPFG